jgi:chromosome segregation ATPase
MSTLGDSYDKGPFKAGPWYPEDKDAHIAQLERTLKAAREGYEWDLSKLTAERDALRAELAANSKGWRQANHCQEQLATEQATVAEVTEAYHTEEILRKAGDVTIAKLKEELAGTKDYDDVTVDFLKVEHEKEVAALRAELKNVVQFRDGQASEQLAAAQARIVELEREIDGWKHPYPRKGLE